MALTVAQLVARLTADTSGFYRGMALANSSMIRSGGIMTRVAAGVGLGIAGMGILSLRAAGNFEQSMNILEAVSGATRKEMGALRTEAIALGADMKLPNVSAKDAADAMAELAKGGLSVKDTLNATRGTLQLGIAANLGFADSAKIVARSLTAFHLEGNQAVRVADLFTAAANKSTAEIGDIALGMQMASAQFAAGDQSIEALTTSLTLMANAGVVGSDAGTSLKTMMNRLMAPTAKARNLFEELGIQIYDSSGNMKAMPDIIKELNDGMKGMSKEQQNAALYTLFGSDAIRAARIQMNAGRKGWLDMEKAVTKGGEAQAFAEARTKGFNGAVQALWSQIETLAIQLGTALLPAATAAVRAMADFVAGIDPNTIIAFFSAISKVVEVMFNLATGVPIVTAALGGFVAALIAFKIITSVIKFIEALRLAFIALNVTMLANPFVLIAAAIIGLGIALVILWKRSETFRAIVTGAMDAVVSAAKAVWDFISNHWPLLVGILTGGLGLAVAMIIKHWDTIKNAFMTALNTVVNAVTSAWNFVKNITTTVFTAILGFFRTWWPLIVVMFAFIPSLIFGFIKRNWDRIKAVTMAVFGAIKAFFRATWNAMKAVVSTVANAIKAVVTRVWNGIKGVTQAIWSVIGDTVKRLLRALWGAVSSILDRLKNIVRDRLLAIRTIFQNIFQGLARVISGVAGALAGAAWDLGKAIIQGIISGVGSLAGSLKDAIVGVAKGALGAAKGALGIDSPSKVFEAEVGVPIIQGIIKGLESLNLQDTLERALLPMHNPIPGATPTRAGGMFASSGPQSVVYETNYYIQGSVLSERELGKVNRREQHRWSRANT